MDNPESKKRVCPNLSLPQAELENKQEENNKECTERFPITRLPDHVAPQSRSSHENDTFHVDFIENTGVLSPGLIKWMRIYLKVEEHGMRANEEMVIYNARAIIMNHRLLPTTRLQAKAIHEDTSAQKPPNVERNELVIDNCRGTGAKSRDHADKKSTEDLLANENLAVVPEIDASTTLQPAFTVQSGQTLSTQNISANQNAAVPASAQQPRAFVRRDRTRETNCHRIRVSDPIDCNLVHFLDSRTLCYNGYRYVRHCNGPRARWQCATHQRPGCKGSVLTVNDVVVKVWGDHSHPPETENVVEPHVRGRGSIWSYKKLGSCERASPEGFSDQMCMLSWNDLLIRGGQRA